MIERWYNSCSK